MDVLQYLQFRKQVVDLDPDAMRRAQNKCPPLDATDLAFRVAFVIVSTGMKFTVASSVWIRVKAALIENGEVGDSFRNVKKKAAIDLVFRERDRFFDEFLVAWRDGTEATIEFCRNLPYLGTITKFHLAKNLGIDVAKPDIWLERVAKASAEEVQAMCARLSRQSGDNVSTVDYVIWRACEQGWWSPDGNPVRM